MGQAGNFKKVAVLMGGPSAEREVSLRSGRAVARGLADAGYDVQAVDVEDRTLDVPDGVEAVFIALHGEFGEDGDVQALLERRGLPYTGSGPRASRAAFDKVLSKRIMSEHGVPTPAYEVLHRGDARALPLPLVLKPASQGSSIGVHRVFAEQDWDAALEDALTYDRAVVAEAFVEGRELTVGVLGDRALPVLEIVAPDNWYDYASKYTSGACRYLVPAPLDEDVAERCRQAALDTFQAHGARGFGRVDLRLDPNGDIFVFELNTIPGFTETSLLPKAAAEFGLNFPALCARIMAMACLESVQGATSGREE